MPEIYDWMPPEGINGRFSCCLNPFQGLHGTSFALTEDGRQSRDGNSFALTEDGRQSRDGNSFALTEALLPQSLSGLARNELRADRGRRKIVIDHKDNQIYSMSKGKNSYKCVILIGDRITTGIFSRDCEESFMV